MAYLPIYVASSLNIIVANHVSHLAIIYKNLSLSMNSVNVFGIPLEFLTYFLQYLDSKMILFFLIDMQTTT